MVLHFHRPFSFGWKYWIIWMMLMLTILLVINLGRVRQDVSFRGNLAAGVLKVLTRDLANDQANNQPKHETYNWKDWNPPHGYHNCLVQLNNTKGYLLKRKKLNRNIIKLSIKFMAVAMLMVTQIRIIRLLLIIQNIVEIYQYFQ